MDLSGLRNVYEFAGPFATVYLEGRSPAEDASEQLRLRWKALREHLSGAGADARVLDALTTTLHAGTDGAEQANGRVLVAEAEGGVVLDAPWDAALGAGDQAHWTVVPELGAYVREAARSVRALVVLADQQGAELYQDVVAEQHVPRETGAETVNGGGGGVHRPRGGALSHNQIQRHADENVERNAKDIVESIRTAASRFHPRIVVLAGEVQARTAIHEQLPDRMAGMVVEAEHGGRGEGASQALREEICQIATSSAARDAEGYADRLNADLAHDQAVQGHQSVAHAAEVGAIDTLLLEHQAPATREAFLLKVCAGTSSAVQLVTAGTGLQDGVGGLLRYPLTSD